VCVCVTVFACSAKLTLADARMVIGSIFHQYVSVSCVLRDDVCHARSRSALVRVAATTGYWSVCFFEMRAHVA
jgi:hypothetical protein